MPSINVCYITTHGSIKGNKKQRKGEKIKGPSHEILTNHSITYSRKPRWPRVNIQNSHRFFAFEKSLSNFKISPLQDGNSSISWYGPFNVHMYLILSWSGEGGSLPGSPQSPEDVPKKGSPSRQIKFLFLGENMFRKRTKLLQSFTHLCHRFFCYLKELCHLI